MLGILRTCRFWFLIHSTRFAMLNQVNSGVLYNGAFLGSYSNMMPTSSKANVQCTFGQMNKNCAKSSLLISSLNFRFARETWTPAQLFAWPQVVVEALHQPCQPHTVPPPRQASPMVEVTLFRQNCKRVRSRFECFFIDKYFFWQYLNNVKQTRLPRDSIKIIFIQAKPNLLNGLINQLLGSSTLSIKKKTLSFWVKKSSSVSEQFGHNYKRIYTCRNSWS